MPMIKIQYDNEKLTKEGVVTLSKAIQVIVSETTEIKDVFVYADSAEIHIEIAPVEIFIEMSAEKITDVSTLAGSIKDRLSTWKGETGFGHPINLTLIPMHWKVETGI